MNIVAADWLPYSLPLKRSWQTSQGCFSERHGKLLRLRTSNGQIGWGDCAPLPDFGIDEAAASAFAEETALLDLVTKKANLPLNAWLSGTLPIDSVAVNTNLGAISRIGEGELNLALAAGYWVLKIKVGIGDCQEEVAHLKRLAGQLPAGRQFRLDANAAWKMPDARAFLIACNELPIEGLEEPLSQPTMQDLATLQSLVNFPLAIDESVRLLDQAFFHHPPVGRLILKPARHGGLLATVRLGLQARAAGIESVVTSSLESSCGLLACAHLAATLAPRSTHGLATSDWLAKDTGQPPPISDGRLYLPKDAGLGFIPTLDQSIGESA